MEALGYGEVAGPLDVVELEGPLDVVELEGSLDVVEAPGSVEVEGSLDVVEEELGSVAVPAPLEPLGSELELSGSPLEPWADGSVEVELLELSPLQELCDGSQADAAGSGWYADGAPLAQA